MLTLHSHHTPFHSTQVYYLLLAERVRALASGPRSSLACIAALSLLSAILKVTSASPTVGTQGLGSNLVGLNPSVLYVDLVHFWPLLAGLPGFLAGACTARLANQLEADGLVRTWGGWAVVDTLLFLVWAALFYCRAGRGWPMIGAFELTLPMACTLLFAATCTPKGLLLRFFSHPALVSFATLSYAAYLLQLPVLRWLTGTGWDFAAAHTVFFFLFLVWILAGLTEMCVEKPKNHSKAHVSMPFIMHCLEGCVIIKFSWM